MDEENKKYFKEKLSQEGSHIEKTIENMKNNDSVLSGADANTELSYYDNHPADFGTQLFDIEHNRGILNHEKHLLTQIDDAKKKIDKGTYGICKRCKKEIDSERLEAIPYAEYCIECKTELEKNKGNPIRPRPAEEQVIDAPFGRKYLNKQEDDEFEGLDYLNDLLKSGSSDTPQDMGGYHEYKDFYTNDTDNQGIVDGIEKISNQQYKKQLPE